MSIHISLSFRIYRGLKSITTRPRREDSLKVWMSWTTPGSGKLRRRSRSRPRVFLKIWLHRCRSPNLSAWHRRRFSVPIKSPMIGSRLKAGIEIEIEIDILHAKLCYPRVSYIKWRNAWKCCFFFSFFRTLKYFDPPTMLEFCQMSPTCDLATSPTRREPFFLNENLHRSTLGKLTIYWTTHRNVKYCRNIRSCRCARQKIVKSILPAEGRFIISHPQNLDREEENLIRSLSLFIYEILSTDHIIFRVVVQNRFVLFMYGYIRKDYSYTCDVGGKCVEQNWKSLVKINLRRQIDAWQITLVANVSTIFNLTTQFYTQKMFYWCR